MKESRDLIQSVFPSFSFQLLARLLCKSQSIIENGKVKANMIYGNFLNQELELGKYVYGSAQTASCFSFVVCPTKVLFRFMSADAEKELG